MGCEFAVHGFKSTHFNPLVIYKDFRSGGRDIPRAERAQLMKRTNTYKKSTWMLPARFCYRVAETALGKMCLADNLVVIGRKQ
jgi:hypothetical protein